MADNFYARYPSTGGVGVISLNGLTGALTLVAGTGITITPLGTNITIASTALLAAITSINSDTTAAQTLSVGTSGTDFAITNPGSGSHVFNLPTASASNRGALSSADWTTFNSKQSALTLGDLTDAGTDGIIITGGTGVVIGSGTSIAQHVADTTHNGYLSSTDWNTFNGKQSSGNYITDLTGDGTASGPGSVALTLATVNSNVGSFGTATQVGTFTVNAKGLITAASNASIQIAESQVTNLVSDLAGKQAIGNYITALTGDATASGPGSVALTLATVNSNVGSFGSASSVSAITVNAKGLVTAAASTSIQVAESQVTNLVSDLAGKQAIGNYITALTGDATASGPGSAALTLATVNSNVGSFGSSTSIPSFTVNAKGLITAASGNVVIAPAGTLSGATLAANVLASSLTSVGTIATGVWNGTAVDVAHGGTGQTSYTDGQLLIGNTSGNTLTKTTLTAGSNITITNGNGSITIAGSASANPAFNVTSQTTTYSAAISDYVIASGASFTITLPTAVGQSGKFIKILHNGTSLTQVYTLNTTSAQTIGGLASGVYKLYTNTEVVSLLSDGSNWQIDEHKTVTPWSADAVITLSASTAYVFSWTGNQSIVVGDTYTDGSGNTFTVTTTTNTTTGTFSGTPGTPATTGTLTRVTGTGVSSIAWTSRTITGQPVKGTTFSDRMIWRRVGQDIELYFEYFQTGAGTAGTGNYIIYLPTNITADVSQISVITAINAQNSAPSRLSMWGDCSMTYGSGTPTGMGVNYAVPYSNNSFRICGLQATTLSTLDGGSNYGIGTAAIQWSGRLFIPVSGWQP